MDKSNKKGFEKQGKGSEAIKERIFEDMTKKLILSQRPEAYPDFFKNEEPTRVLFDEA